MMTTMTVCLGTKTRRIAGTGSHQKAEALPPQEKRKLAKAERRRPAVLQKAERRKAQIRRVFELFNLNRELCTDRDDEIRQITGTAFRLEDAPFMDLRMKNERRRRSEAMWIVGRVPISAGFYAAENGSTEFDPGVYY
jgi:hypothetical protein